MNYINKRAQNFVQKYNFESDSQNNELVNLVKSEINNIDDISDKITFLRVVLEHNAQSYQRHLLKCTNKENCSINEGCESRTYYLTQELNRLGIKTNNDQFTTDEKNDIEVKFDQIMSDLQTLKFGQQIIYDDLKDEIDSLRELYILGKKTWYQLLLGKTADMVISGIISETVSKEIISGLKDTITNALN